MSAPFFQSPRAEVVLVLSRSRSVTPAAESSSSFHDRSCVTTAESYAAAAGSSSSYNYVNMSSSRPPKILESPLDSKSLLSGIEKARCNTVDVPGAH